MASRDREILDYLPPSIRSECCYVSHYRDECDYDTNGAEAVRLLRLYRDEAKIVITTFLHCAMPCIAMGIPVIAVLPRPDSDFMSISNCQRFSGLDGLVPVYELDDLSHVNWDPKPINVELLKQRIEDNFYAKVESALRKLGAQSLIKKPLSWMFPSALLTRAYLDVHWNRPVAGSRRNGGNSQFLKHWRVRISAKSKSETIRLNG